MTPTILTDADLPPGRLALTVGEFATIFGLRRSTAYLAVTRGEIPVMRFGKTMRVSIPKLKRMANDGCFDRWKVVRFR